MMAKVDNFSRRRSQRERVTVGFARACEGQTTVLHNTSSERHTASDRKKMGKVLKGLPASDMNVVVCMVEVRCDLLAFMRMIVHTILV